jgi:hypothetical protein
MFPPININVLPTQSSPLISSSSGTEATPPKITQADSIDIPGLLEAVEEYTSWHLSRVSTNSFKENLGPLGGSSSTTLPPVILLVLEPARNWP